MDIGDQHMNFTASTGFFTFSSSLKRIMGRVYLIGLAGISIVQLHQDLNPQISNDDHLQLNQVSKLKSIPIKSMKHLILE